MIMDINLSLEEMINMSSTVDDYLVNVECNKYGIEYLSVGSADLLSVGADRAECPCCSNINYIGGSNIIAKIEKI